MIKFLSRVHLNGHTKTFHPLVVEGKFCCGGEFSMALSLSFPFRNILKPKSFVGTIHSQLHLFESKCETVV